MTTMRTKIGSHKTRVQGTGIIFLILFSVSCFLAPPLVLGQGPGRISFMGSAFESPLVTSNGVDSTHGPATGLKVNYTRGKFYLGNGAVAVVAGSVSSLTASQNDCAAPGYLACNIIYANSSGTVSKTLSISTANSTGNTVLAFVRTGVSSVIGIQQAWQNTVADITAAIVLGSTTISTAALGTVRDIHGQVTLSYAGSVTSGNAVGVRGLATIGSTATLAGGFVYGVQGKIVAAGTLADGGTTTAVLAQYDTSTLTSMTGGQHSALWIDGGAASTGTLANMDAVRINNVGGSTWNTVLDVNGRYTVFGDFHDNLGSAWYAPSSGSCTRQAELKVLLPGGAVGYIPICTD